MKRNKILTLLKDRVPAPLVAAVDQYHPSRVVVRDPTDHSDGSKHGRWILQVFQGQPVADVTVWHHPQQVLEQTGVPWIAAFDGERERTGFKDEIDLADWVVQSLKRRRT